MSYIGRGVDAISNVEKLDNITFDGSTTYALTKSSAAFTPVGANNLLVSIDGVIQQGNFSVSTTNIVFDWSPTSSNTNNFILHYGTGVLNVPADGSIVAAKMAANSVDSASYVDGSIDAVHLSANSVDSDSYVDGSIDAVHLSANSVDSDAYVDGSIDAVHMSANSIDSDSYVDASIDNAHLADDAVGVAELSATGTASSSTFLRGDNAWASAGGTNSPNFYAYVSASTTAFTSGVLTKVPFNTEWFDVGACFDTTNNRFVVPAGEGGKYYFFASVRFADGLTSKELSFVPYLNGSGFGWIQLHTPSYSSGWHTVWGHFTNDLSATDYVEIYARHNKGSDHNIGGGNTLNTTFGGFKLIE